MPPHNGKWTGLIGGVLALVSLAMMWGVTLARLDENSKKLEKLESTLVAIDRRLADHEKLPWHGGYAATLPLTMKILEDLQRSVQELKQSRRNPQPGGP